MASEIRKAFQTGRQNYNRLDLLKKAAKVAFDKKQGNKSKKTTVPKKNLAPSTEPTQNNVYKKKDQTMSKKTNEGNKFISARDAAIAAGKKTFVFDGRTYKVTDKDPKDVKRAKQRYDEGLADMAIKVDKDHEIQMARSDLYKLAEYSIKLHEMLKSIPEQKGMKGWQQAKITKAADYISSVFHSLDYDMKFPPDNDAAMNDMPATEGSYKSDAQRKAVHAAKSAKAKKESTDPYITILRQQLSEKAVSKDQQRAAGIALKHKRKGTQPAKGSASASMMNMSTKELEKLAGTEHKGLPKDKS
jgi:hypothetical protein